MPGTAPSEPRPVIRHAWAATAGELGDHRSPRVAIGVLERVDGEDLDLASWLACWFRQATAAGFPGSQMLTWTRDTLRGYPRAGRGRITSCASR